jgi:hypothetical protein
LDSIVFLGLWVGHVGEDPVSDGVSEEEGYAGW